MSSTFHQEGWTLSGEKQGCDTTNSESEAGKESKSRSGMVAKADGVGKSLA